MQYLVLFVIVSNFLLASNCPQQATDQAPMVPLIVAVKKGELKKVCRYLRVGVDPNSKDQYGNMALHWAAYCDKDGDITKKLLEKGAKIDALDPDGFTPLDWAYKQDHIPVMKVLIQKAIDLNITPIPCTYLKTLLHWAIECKDDQNSNDMVEYLLKYLPSLGLNINIQNDWGKTPLHCAVERKNIDIVKLLLDTGARTDLQDKHGNIPLELPTSKNILVELLLHG